MTRKIKGKQEKELQMNKKIRERGAATVEGKKDNENEEKNE